MHGLSNKAARWQPLCEEEFYFIRLVAGSVQMGPMVELVSLNGKDPSVGWAASSGLACNSMQHYFYC